MLRREINSDFHQSPIDKSSTSWMLNSNASNPFRTFCTCTKLVSLLDFRTSNSASIFSASLALTSPSYDIGFDCNNFETMDQQKGWEMKAKINDSNNWRLISSTFLSTLITITRLELLSKDAVEQFFSFFFNFLKHLLITLFSFFLYAMYASTSLVKLDSFPLLLQRDNSRCCTDYLICDKTSRLVAHIPNNLRDPFNTSSINSVSRSLERDCWESGSWTKPSAHS